MSAGYSGTPLPKKLGIAAGGTVVLWNAPGDFVDILEPLPEDVSIVENRVVAADVTVMFVERIADVAALLGRLEAKLERGKRLWVAWPKKASGRKTDVDFDGVQSAGLELGIVDTKVCAIDAVWTGLCFMRRKDDAKR